MYYLLLLSVLVAGCQYLPAISQDIEDIANNTAIMIEVSKDTFKKETDLGISINVKNKDEPNKVPVF